MTQHWVELQVDAGDFDHGLNVNDRWQREAASSLVQALQRTGEFATVYRKRRNQTPEFVQAIHDAIFVAAPRGAGKTVFLRNAKAMWEEQNESDRIKLHFCPEVDPTLLVDNDNFANVVIAHLFNQVDRRLEGASIDSKHRNAFYEALEHLGSALGNAEHASNELAGIDRIISYRSGIQLERYFHDYAQACADILEVNAIVLPVDDVDMALGRAFEVLDVVRRLLGCPYIIPLVSGDKSLYQPIIVDHFVHGGDARNDRNLLAEIDAEKLTDAYLTKLFPVEFRVSLLPLDELIPNMRIMESGDTDGVSASKYFAILQRETCPLVNGEERSRNWPRPVTAREMVQLCRLFPPSFVLTYESKMQDFWYRYQSLAEARYHGPAYLTALGERRLLSIRASGDFVRLDELAAFNVLQQARQEPGEWNERPYYEQIDAAIVALKLSGPIEISQRRFVKDLQERPCTLRSMPPIEFFTETLQVPKFREQLRNQGLTGHDKFVFDLYCHHALYGTSRRTSAQIFFGRPLEVLFLSLFLANGTKDLRKERTDHWDDCLSRIMAAPPFHSVYSLAPTKTLDDDGLEAASEEDTLDAGRDAIVDKLNEDAKFSRRNFAEKISKWECEHWETLEHAQTNGLVNLLHCVFNKTFTQLHIMRVKAVHIFVEDDLTDVAKRFEYVLINAFASFLNPKVVQQNTAHTPNAELIRNPVAYGQKDPSFRDNVINFIGNRGSDPDSRIVQTEHQLLLRAVWSHPLFGLIHGEPKFSLARPGKRLAARKPQVAEAATLLTQLREMMPRSESLVLLMSKRDAVSLIARMEQLCKNHDTSLERVYAGRANGKAIYLAVRRAAGFKES